MDGVTLGAVIPLNFTESCRALVLKNGKFDGVNLEVRQDRVNVALIGLVIVACLGIVMELSLRQFLGFGNPLLYVADPQIGYLLAPNQSVRRFGNRIQINQYSMRSPAMSPERPAQTLRVLLLGDSIANGGWWTDQADILSALLQRQLQPAIAPTPFTQVEVLNASANSWGPRNELAYLHHYGQFSAQVIVLLINTDDLFATAPTSVQVGRDRNYPDKKPPLALVELVNRYLLKPEPIPELEALQAEGGDRVGINLDAIRQIHHLAQQTNTQFILAMTPLLREVGEPGPRDYEHKARQRLIDFAQQEHILYLDFLPNFNQAVSNGEPPQSLYHDHIHLSPTGNQMVSQRVIDHLKPTLSAL